MKSTLKPNKFHIYVILFGLAWLALLNYALQLSQQNIIYPDSDNYLESAKNLFFHLEGHYYRPLLMAFITGIPYLFGATNATVFSFSLLVNIICWLGSSLILFELIKSFSKPKTALFFAFLYISCVGSSVIIFHLLTESIYTFLLMAIIFFLKKYYDTKQFLYLSLALSILIASMLVKPGSKFIAILAVIYFIKVLIVNYKQKAIMLVYFAFTLVLLQVVALKHLFGNYTISYIDVVTYHNYICSKAKCIENGKIYVQENNPRANHLFSVPYKKQKEIAVADLKDQLANNKINLVKAYVSDLAQNTSHGCYAVNDCKNINGSGNFSLYQRILFEVSKFQNRALTLLGFALALFFAYRNYNKEVLYALVAAIILYIILVSGISCGQGDRFHIVLFPLIILLIAKITTEKRFSFGKK